MFSGLNKFLKIILPKIFYRALIIVAAPTIILQLIITIVFYDVFGLKQIKILQDRWLLNLKQFKMFMKTTKNLDFFTDSYKNNFNFEIGITKEVCPKTLEKENLVWIVL